MSHHNILFMKSHVTLKTGAMTAEYSGINYILEVPLLWVTKGSYFVFGIPNNRLTCMLGQKALSLSDNMH